MAEATRPRAFAARVALVAVAAALALSACQPPTASPPQPVSGTAPIEPADSGRAAAGPDSSEPASDPAQHASRSEHRCAEPENIVSEIAPYVLELEGTADRPGLRALRIDGTGFSKTLTGHSGHVFVGAHPRLHLSFDRLLTADAFAALLAVDGEASARLDVHVGDDGTVTVDLPNAPAGTAVTVTLTGIVAPAGDSLTVTMCYGAPPSVGVEWFSDGVWAPLPVDETVSAPVQLRLRFSEPMDRTSVADSLAGPDSQGAGQPAPVLSWSDDQTVELTWAAPGPAIYIDLHAARSQTGLGVSNEVPVLYTGAQPHIVAVHPGEEDVPLAPLPPNVTKAYPSPDGRYVLVEHVRPAATWGGPVTGHVSIIDLATGERTGPFATAGPWGLTSVFWTDDGVALVSGEAVTVYDHAGRVQSSLALPEHFRASVSPDGQLVALLRQSEGEEYNPVHPFYWHDLEIWSPGTDERHVIPRLLQLYRPAKDGYTTIADLAWSPDSAFVAMFADGEELAASLIIVEAATGRVSMRLPVGDMWGSLHRVTWSPDGRYVTAGPFLLAASAGEPLAKFAAYAPDPHWSADGNWLLWHDRPWGPVYVYNTATHSPVLLGEGFAAGWDGDGRALIIRWERSEAAYDPFAMSR